MPTSSPTSRRALQVAVAASALLPLVTGPLAYLRGGRAIAGARVWDAPVESELRYLSVWWFGAGLRLLATVPHIEREGPALRQTLALMALGGLGRLLALRAKGTPHPLMLAATGVEIVLPAVLVVWQGRVEHAASRVDDHPCQ